MKKLILIFIIPLLFGTVLFGCVDEESLQEGQEGVEPQQQEETF
ncbi:MAG: hypothetical protein ACOC3T_06425 [Bacteroidota bacterium]